MKLSILILLIGLSFQSLLAQEDTVTYEYARLMFTDWRIRVYYENGSWIDLRKELKIEDYFRNADAETSKVFFKVNNFLREQKFHLVTSNVMGGRLEYIYRRRKFPLSNK